MAGHRNYNELRARIAPSRRGANERWAEKELERLVLPKLRRLGRLTQSDVSKRLGISQPAVAKLEQQRDIQVSTLQRLIEALGGTLEIIAHLPHGDYRIGQFAPAKRTS
jgi:DNA-binding Xre family transcriptional regulator